MKKVLNFTLAIAMTLGLVFIGEVTSSNNPLSVQGQTRRGQVTVRRKSNPGIIRSAGRGAKYVGRKTYRGAKYVGRKTVQGTKYVARKTVRGTKYAGKKTYKGGRMVTSRAKKIIY